MGLNINMKAYRRVVLQLLCFHFLAISAILLADPEDLIHELDRPGELHFIKSLNYKISNDLLINGTHKVN